MKKEKYIRLKNFSLVTFLYSNDYQIAGINKVNDRQKEFSFIKSDPLDELIYLWTFGDKEDDRLLVNVHKYQQARSELLNMLNS